MSAENDARNASKVMSQFLFRKMAATRALADNFAQAAVNDFFDRQLGDEFWENRTGQALSRVFAFGFKRQGGVGFRMAHGVDYGVYLELANDRRHEAIRPVTFEWGKRFLENARKLLA